MVRGRVAPPPANPKRGVTVSHYPAFQLSGCCHQYLRAMDKIVTMSVNEGEIKVMVIMVITVSVMNLKHVRCSQAQATLDVATARGLIDALLEAVNGPFDF